MAEKTRYSDAELEEFQVPLLWRNWSWRNVTMTS